MDDDLQARLESHAQAFEGLLSLIPAKDYYAQDNSDQWQRKKQTKEEKRAARRAKLDPANQKSAMDVINDNEKKRKRELGIGPEDDDSVSMERPGEGLRPVKKLKKGPTKATVNGVADGEQDAANKTKADKRKEKRERKKEKVEQSKIKSELKKARKQEQITEAPAEAEEGLMEDDDVLANDDEVEANDFSGLVDEAPNLEEAPSTAPSSPDRDSPVFDISADHSTASSSSSIIPDNGSATVASDTAALDAPKEATTNGISVIESKKAKSLNLPEVDQEKLQARLKARIEELRAKRKADGPDGQPARSRQQLLESRRQKSEARKKHKKELRAKAKADEERINQERLQGSGSPLSADIFSPRSPMVEHNTFSFGRVAFEDGAAADAGLTDLLDPRKKKKGPQDPKAALEMAKKKENRLLSMDEEKRGEIKEKDRWLNAKKRAHGERVRDDTSLLKKALKRKEKQKSKSEKAWSEREEGVRKGKEMKQKKREDNLAKRRDEKGNKGKKVKGKPSKKKRRPGFEGK